MITTSGKSIKNILKYSFGILLNANDFFGCACADAVLLDANDIEWAALIVDKYGIDGVNAVMSFIRKEKPLPSYQTDKFEQAYKELEYLNPDVWSD